MKELSIEEKAKAYDEAIEKAKKWFNSEEPDSYTCIVESIFPELKESEDERIRKEIIDIIDSYDVAHLKAAGLPSRIPEYIAYLEKQGEQKSIIVTKFRVGDVITDNTGAYPHKKIEAIENENYVVRCLYTNCQQYIPINTQDEYILVADKQIKEGCWYLCIKSYHHLGGDDYWFKEGAVYFCEKEGFLRSSKNNNIYVYDCEHWQMYFAPYEQNPVEWSEEDKDKNEAIVSIIRQKYDGTNIEEKKYYNTLINWLKSLRPQKQWKPSEEQMAQLGWIAKQNKDNMIGKELMSLYQDLKKLRKE